MTGSDPPPERRKVLGVESFAHRRGQVKALQSFRQRQEHRRVHKASALRQYKKAMKQSGYEPGQGAGRRRNEESEKDEETGQPGDVKQLATAEHGNRQEEKRRHKADPLAKAVEKAAKKKIDMEQSARDQKQRERERQQRLRERRERTHKLKQRTKKGQPIMKNIVEDILKKLEKK